MSYRLNAQERWKLAITLMLLYYPVLLYIDLPVYQVAGRIPIGMILHESISIVVVTGIFFIWVSVSEWMLSFFFERMGEEFLLELNGWSQLIAFAAAAALSYTFVFASNEVLMLLQSVADRLLSLNLFLKITEPHESDFYQLYKRTNIGFIMLIMLSSFYLIANRRANMRMKEAELHRAQLEKENTQAQLNALRNQVSPHFLFNSLNILSSLVHDKSDATPAFINELSRFYRYTLDQSKQDIVSLRTELAFIDSYLFLLRKRFGEKINVQMAIDESVQDRSGIAPLTLQLLIENAVKHNQMSEDKPLEISLSITGDMIRISNKLQRRTDPAETTRVGLTNIVERYRLLTERKLSIVETGDEFNVTIPLLTL